MAKVMNTKEEPMALEKAIEFFKKGIVVHEAAAGLCLVGTKFDKKYQWWIDLCVMFSDKSLPPMPSQRSEYKAWCEWCDARDALTDAINQQLWGIQAPMRMYAF